MKSLVKAQVQVQLLMALSLGTTAWADQIIQPTNGKGWGEGATAESLLNMNRDPEAVRKIDPDKTPILISGSCTDENGKTYTGEDDEYSQCMNHKSAKNKAAAPASVSKKN